MKKLSKVKIKHHSLTVLMIIGALIAPIGMIPYAWDFPKNITAIPVIVISLGVLCLITALPANAVLGFYSLTVLRNNKIDYKEFILVAIFSFLAAIPLGFISFFGYQDSLNTILNVALSIVIILVNFAIGFNGVHNGIKDFLHFKKTYRRIDADEMIIRSLVFLLGLAMTVTFYLAGTNGLHELLKTLKLTAIAQPFFIYPFAIFLWFPLACLFSNSFQNVAGKLYRLIKIKEFHKKINFFTLSLFIFCLFSGSAFAQMTKEFFTPDTYMPNFFKIELIQNVANFFLVPLAILVSASVNAVALTNLIEKIFKKKV